MSLAPFLADYLYIGGGVGLLILIIIIVLVMRR